MFFINTTSIGLFASHFCSLDLAGTTYIPSVCRFGVCYVLCKQPIFRINIISIDDAPGLRESQYS